MSEAIDVARSEDEGAAEVKRVAPKFVLLMTRGTSARAVFEIVETKNVQDVCGSKIGDAVGLALFVDEQREVDAGFLAENAGVVTVAEADRRQGRALITEGSLVFAQLRDVLAAENSPIVA